MKNTIGELLDLLTFADKAGIHYYITLDDLSGLYTIKITFFDSNNRSYTEEIVIDRFGEHQWSGSYFTIEQATEKIVAILNEQEQNRIKQQKRKALIQSLTKEQRELLDL